MPSVYSRGKRPTTNLTPGAMHSTTTSRSEPRRRSQGHGIRVATLLLATLAVHPADSTGIAQDFAELLELRRVKETLDPVSAGELRTQDGGGGRP